MKLVRPRARGPAAVLGVAGALALALIAAGCGTTSSGSSTGQTTTGQAAGGVSTTPP